MKKTDGTSSKVTDTLEQAWPLPETFAFDGRDVRFGRMGQGAPLVLVHGWPFSSVVWRRIAPLLARHREVIYFDLIGYGQSRQTPDQDGTLGIQNQVLAALIDHCGLKKPDVIAHDVGGLTALRAHLLDGCDYRSLLLFDCVATTPFGSGFVQYARKHRKALDELPAYLHEAVLRAYIREAAFKSIPEDVMKLLVEPWLGEDWQPQFYRYLGELDDRYPAEIEERYADLRCPVTILWGEEDALLPIEDGRRFAERVPGASLRAVPQAGHLVQLDAPEAIAAAALEQLLAAK